MKPRPKRTQRNVVVAIIAATLGCALLAVVVAVFNRGDRPSAPALRPEPVYQNSREGFRFVAPEGWTLIAKSDLPSGPATTEHMLVRYQAAAEKPASFEVSRIDLPETTSYVPLLSAPSFGVAGWGPVGAPEPLPELPNAATRYAFEYQNKAKEIVVFRRKERVYFFTIFFGKGDVKTRNGVRKVIDGVVWTK